ncbi:hypothetical protein LV82_00592 [Albidovulum inexpectatum]|uniref:Inner membrane protein n=1 Tax=Albidovulum inexpectatum TaxID=196587 RepID=A0A2S5JMM6_9RHOB|nr:YbaN family protein [Albidovulum inexpectatum]PPB82653.1 hypothetical protein LV82_00592 [Albidovulum inexpectatum]
MRPVWTVGGLVALALGLAGIALPLLPTVPFLLLAALCFARGSEYLHDWLLTHPRLGPPIHDWQERGAVSRRAKWAATLFMLIAIAVPAAIGVALWITIVQGATLGAVALFLWSRPEP